MKVFGQILNFLDDLLRIEHLVSLGILREISGRKRDRVYVHDQYLDILKQGTEPLEK